MFCMINYVIPKTILRGTNHDRGQQTSLVQTGNKHPRHCRPLEALTYATMTQLCCQAKVTVNMY